MYILKILFKNALRHKLRTGLTVLGVTIAILAFGLLKTFVSAWYAGVEASSSTRLVTRNSISIIFSLPLSYQEKIRQVKGVTKVSYGNWFGGIYIEEKNFFANFAIEPRNYFELYPEFMISSVEKTAFIKDRKSFVAGQKLIAKYGWKIGDTVTLKGTIFPGNWEFVLRGIYKGKDKSTDESQFLFHWDYLNETIKKTMPGRGDHVGFYLIGIDGPEIAADVASRIDRMFENSLAETLTETEKAFQLSFVAMSDALITVIRLVSFIVIVIILAVVANTMNMTARERIGEYSILKTLGFGGWRIAGLIFGESLVITLLGCTFGILFTFPTASVFAEILGTYFPVFIVEKETVYLDVVLSVSVGMLAGVIPAYSSTKIAIADGLRRIG